MNIFYELCDNLPKLAWQAEVDIFSGLCKVVHGPWVEVSERGFIEGAWDGSFSEFAFSESACIFGSGAILESDRLVFVSSTSTTDCLYYSEENKKFHFSNSLPFLLSCVQDELDPHFIEYPAINESMAYGIKKYTKKIPTKNGFVSRIIHQNLVVGLNLFKEVEKPFEPGFEDFKSYFEYIDDRYSKIVANARDNNRVRPMDIFSTQSKGYDSTAVNAIAKKYGVGKVFTVTKGKSPGHYMGGGRNKEPDDDGTEICKQFGLQAIPFQRHDTKSSEAYEYLVYATAHESGDINMLPIIPHISKPTLLLTGCLGEIWYTHEYNPERSHINSDLVRGDLGGHAMTESRLQAGYVQLSFPFIGARSRQDIFAITMSEEMNPWRLNIKYDRPIPRRIAEEAGLPRHMFGQIKMASLVETPSPVTPLGESLRKEYLKYLRTEKILSRMQILLLPWIRKWNGMLRMTSPRRHRWNYYLQRLISKLIRRDFYFPSVWSKLNGEIFCFCVNKRAREYRVLAVPGTVISNPLPFCERDK